jgi:hypothetical protein
MTAQSITSVWPRRGLRLGLFAVHVILFFVQAYFAVESENEWVASLLFWIWCYVSWRLSPFRDMKQLDFLAGRRLNRTFVVWVILLPIWYSVAYSPRMAEGKKLRKYNAELTAKRAAERATQKEKQQTTSSLPK